MNNFVNCPLCDSTNGKEIGIKKNSRFVECMECGLIRIDPPPAHETINDQYNYFDLSWRLPKAKRKVWRYRLKLLPIRLISKGKYFLDIGCNLGSMVEAARLNGYEAHGLEVDYGSVSIAEKLFPKCKFFNETLEELAARGMKFDVIHCTEVIEHIPDLNSFMSSLSLICKEETLLLFSTPDSGHFRVNRKKLLDWKEMRPIIHVAIFNRKNIKALFTKFGFTPIFFYPSLRPNLKFIARRSALRDG